MPTLKNSRGKFFEVHQMPPNRSFWHYFLEWSGRLQEQPEGDIRGLSSWKPERSNCPELTAVIENLIRNVPIEWRAQASNIFVGRVLDAAPNAQAWTRVKAGIIEINIQYTFILSAYVATFEEYMQSVKTLLQGILDEPETIEGIVNSLDHRLSIPWAHLEESRPTWMDSRLLGGGNPALLQLTPPDRVQFREDAVLACEEFAVAHELAHHLLYHTVSRPGKSKAKATVERAIREAHLTAVMTKCNQLQAEEIQADILAFMMVANAINKAPEFSDLYRALIGSVVTLVSLAHVHDTWIATGNDASHPDFIARFDVICHLTEWLSGSRSKGEIGDHPLGLLAQLRGFSAVAINAWLHREFPDKVGRVDIVNIANHVLELGVEANEKMPKDSRFGVTI